MTRRLKELTELRETEVDKAIDYTNETRFFRVSRSTYEWLEKHGSLAAISLCEWMEHDTVISVSAEVDPDTGWNGWSWIWDEFVMAGMNPELYGL